MPGQVQDKVTIITGGSQGFGAAIVDLFVAEGAKVINIDLNPPKEPNPQVKFIKGDVTKVSTWETAVKEAVDSFGGLDVVVNNAGWSYVAKTTHEVTEEEFDKVFNINVKAIYISANVVVPFWIKQGRGGSFITISSTAGIRPRPKLSWYNATKAAVSTATKTMAVEYGPQNIRFNSVCPVGSNTPLFYAFAGGSDVIEESITKFKNTIPLGRLSEPSDIANATLWLASEKSNFINGIDLPVDGGRTV